MALPLGELSTKVTERALHPNFPSPSSLCSSTSPKGRGKGDARHFSCRGTPPLALPLGELSPQATERALHPGFPSPSSLCSATSPKERGKGDARHFSCRGTSPLALPLGELSPKVTERVLHSGLPSPSSLRSATSPKGRGKGDAHYFSCRGTPPLALPLGELSP